MLRRSGTKPGLNVGAQGSRSAALEAIDALYKQEMEDNIAALRAQRRRNRIERSISRWTEYWPVAVGVCISLIAPLLRELIAPLQQWGMWIVFPLVALAERPEIYMGDKMAVILPIVALYVQFPLEGLLAKTMLKGNVSLAGVAWQVLFFHALCLIELWLISGTFRQMFTH
jgi:hypothetical protein